MCTRVLVKNWARRYGAPDSVHSDQRKNFESHVFEESCLADEVPAGELKHGGECDKGVDTLDKEGGGIAEDVQNREANREERTEDKHDAKEEESTGQSQGLWIVGWNWRKMPTQRRFTCSRWN